MAKTDEVVGLTFEEAALPFVDVQYRGHHPAGVYIVNRDA